MTTSQTPPTSELLARLNSLRADLGQPAIKAWKESRAKLEAALDKAKEAAQAKLDAKVEEAEKPSGDLKDHPIVQEQDAKAAKAKPAKTPAAKATDKPTFSLADVARELNINPKVARAKARRHAKDLDAMRTGTDAWAFDAKHRAAVTKLLKGS